MEQKVKFLDWTITYNTNMIECMLLPLVLIYKITFSITITAILKLSNLASLPEPPLLRSQTLSYLFTSDTNKKNNNFQIFLLGENQESLENNIIYF